MNCLIVGGTGFIGHNLAIRLMAMGHSVTILSRSAEKQENLKKLISECYWIVGDIAESNKLDNAMKKIDIVFHLSSSVIPKSSNDNLFFDINSNLVGSINLFEQAKKNNVRKIIFISSGGTVYGIPQNIPIPEIHLTNPICSYGIIKLAIEKYLHFYNHLYKLDYSILRVSNVYGSLNHNVTGFGAVDTFVRKALKNEPIEIWGDGAIIRDYIHINDVVDAIVTTMNFTDTIKTFNIGSGKGESLNEIISLIELELGHKITSQYLPGRPFDIPVNVLDISLAKKVLRWTPKIELSKGIKMLIHETQFI